MLKKHSQLFISLAFISDLIVISLSWILAYLIRFEFRIGVVTEGEVSFSEYMTLLPVIILFSAIILRYFGLYLPKRGSSFIYEFLNIFKTSTITVLLLIVITFFYRTYSYSRAVMIFFWITTIFALFISRGLTRQLLRWLRKKGFNLRHVLIIGANELGKKVLEKIKENPWTGFKVVGFIRESSPEDSVFYPEYIDNVKVLGGIESINKEIRDAGVDQVFIALPLEAHRDLEKVLRSLEEEVVDIRVIPDFFQFMTLNSGIEDLDGLPVINLSESPLYGWNRVIKRLADITFSLFILLIFSPVMLVISVLIKLTSEGPVFYKQKRLGLGGEVFDMLKFRSMKVDAEKDTGPVWASKDDERVTGIGKLLRRYSFDEIPQFINVLKGDMSIVGPRPERPVFIEGFKKKVPKYMLRHKMKAGITGWAQVNGWRGNTSLEKRLDHDLFYIENWSLAFDMKIMWLTFWKGLINKNAY
jgi:Undecaprenyl-phosphate glucose phosphotransferase